MLENLIFAAGLLAIAFLLVRWGMQRAKEERKDPPDSTWELF